MRNLGVLVCSLCAVLLAADIKLLTTAELHGAINRGSTGLLGGIHGVANVVKEQRIPSDLLLDAGGFSAGGLYDLQTAGKMSDSARSEQIVDAMTELRYDAVTFGDDDLTLRSSVLARWITSGLPVVSANVAVEGVVIPKVIRINNSLPVIITGMTTADPLLVSDKGVSISPVVPSLKTVMENLNESDFVILLAHGTPEEIDMVLASYPQIDLVVRGHRTGSGNPVDSVRQKPILGFHVGGDRIARTAITQSGVCGSSWLEVPSVKGDKIEGKSARVVVDCYIMSGCRFGVDAVRELLNVINLSGQSLECHISFSGNIRGDSLVPGLSSGSLNEELLFTAVRENYPDKFEDFLWLWSREDGSAAAAIREMKLDDSFLEAWIKQKGMAVLKTDYNRAERLQVTASPAIFLNNRLYDRALDRSRFLFDICAKLPSLELCNEFGECFDHGDCEPDSGSVGRCELGENGKKNCRYYHEKPVEIVQVLPDDSSYIDINLFTLSTQKLFPSAQFRTVRHGAREADSILFFYQADILPLYLFDSSIVTMKNFDQIAADLVVRDNRFTVKSELVKGDFFYKRPLENGTRLLFAKYDSLQWNELTDMFLDETFLPDFALEQLESEQNHTDIQRILKRGGFSLSPESFFDRYLNGIAADTPVWLLENNRKVRGFSSPNEFQMWKRGGK